MLFGEPRLQANRSRGGTDRTSSAFALKERANPTVARSLKRLRVTEILTFSASR